MSDSSPRSLNVAVIGAGGIARSVHLPALNDMPDVNLVAICDLVEHRARELADKHAIPRLYTIYHDMLAQEEIDAVLVLVEPSNIFHVVMNCLDAGLDTFMEKPPGITLFQAESLRRHAAEKDKILQVGFNRRYIPLVRHVVALIRERTRITQVEGCFYKNHSGSFDRGGISAFASDTIHAIDLIRWIAGGEVEAAATIAAQHEEPVLNAWNGICRFDNGVTGIVKANYQTGGRVHRFEIHGPGLSAFIDLGFGGPSCSAIMLQTDDATRYSLAASGGSERGVTQIDGLELAGSTAFYRYYGFYDEDRHFIDCVRNRSQPDTSIEDAVKTVRVVETLTRNLI